MGLAPDLQSRLLLLYLDKVSAYAASQELGINYRTAKKYYDQLDQLVEQTQRTVVSCILQEIAKTPSEFMQKYMQVQEIQVNTSDDDEES